MSDDLVKSLECILGRIKQDRFGGREAPVVSASEGTRLLPSGALTGEIRVHIRRRNGDMALLHTQSLDGICTDSRLHDAFAEALSMSLADHDSWPR